ncbi:hypothetical protein D3C80_1444130 [compost metagenome]
MRQGRPFDLGNGLPYPVRRCITEAEATTRQTDLSKHRGKRHGRPIGLFAEIGALQRPGHHQEAARIGKRQCQISDRFGRHAADTGRPSRRFFLPICSAADIVRKLLVAYGMTFQKLQIRAIFCNQHMHHREQHRGICAWPDGKPFDIVADRIVADR